MRKLFSNVYENVKVLSDLPCLPFFKINIPHFTENRSFYSLPKEHFCSLKIKKKASIPHKLQRYKIVEQYKIETFSIYVARKEKFLF